MTNPILKARLTLMVPLTLCAAFTAIFIPAMAAEATPTAITRSGPVDTKMAEDKTPQARINHLHDELKITSGQQALWNNVALVMRANAVAIDSAMKDRARMSKGMIAINDLRSYQAIVEAHADGIKKLARAFAPLYASMPEDQQKNADAVFGHRTQPLKLKTRG